MSDNPYAPPAARVSDVITVDTEQELASRLARLGGAIVDSLISFVIIVPIGYMTGYVDAALSGVSASLGTQLMMGVLGVVLVVVLNGYLIATSGQTIGKRVAGTRVVSVEDGRILSLGKYIGLRMIPVSLIGLIPVVGTFLALIDPLLIFRSDRRCLHDLIAGTKVVNVNAVGSLGLRGTSESR
jgi:uncharacterized RDD family membrane protein YckC